MPAFHTNEWDYVRIGTLEEGEQIVASDPPAGTVDPGDYPTLDRFTVTFDAAHYPYIDDITVAVLDPPGAPVPQVIKTRRRNNGAPETVEIVLDRPMAPGTTTRFTFDDGTAQNVVEYTVLAPDPGACCLPTGVCQNSDELACPSAGGAFMLGAVCLGDLDSDGVDGACGDACPTDPNKVEPGLCGCGLDDTGDTDGDTVLDCFDQCPGVDDRVFAPGCATAIPTASGWGVIILGLVLACAGKIGFGLRRDATAELVP